MQESIRDKKKRNAVITGLRLKGDLSNQNIEKWIEKKLEVKVKIEKTWKMGIKGAKIGIICSSIEEKLELMLMARKKNLLKEKVYIHDDLT